MKPLKILQHWEAQLHKKINSSEIISKSIFPLGALILIAEAIWIIGPHLTIAGHRPLSNTETRVYLIICFFLIWLLKFLLFDLTYTARLPYKDLKTRKKIQALTQRFAGATAFLNKTTVNQSATSTKLHERPWVLLIGPAQAGKTSLLANANIHYILQRQFTATELENMKPSENCDWWITRETCIVDIPSNYCTNLPKKEQAQNSQIWEYFLQLIKKERGKSGINGIIIALPADDLLQKKYQDSHHAFWQDFVIRLHQIQKIFPEPIPCQIIITKCDLLPGFKEFFSESTAEEIEQSFGISLHAGKIAIKVVDLFASRFNAMIKKINQQLLWRLHHERNPLIRPYIKNFPLQLECLKDALTDFIKKLTAKKLNLALDSIYLTSALQRQETNDVIIDEAPASQRGLQLYKNPHTSRTHFIKQLLETGLAFKQVHHPFFYRTNQWKQRTAYAASLSIILFCGYLLGKDFQTGIKHTYTLQKDLADFQLRIADMQDPLDHFIETIHLLNTIQPSPNHQVLRAKWSDILFYYSKQSQNQSNAAYQKALFAILIPEMQHFLQEYLKNPVNKDAQDIYAVLSAYLMLGDASHLNPNYIVDTFAKIMPKHLSDKERNGLNQHLSYLFNQPWHAVSLNEQTIKETRNYLNALPKIKLAYIILQNMHNNSQLAVLDIGLDETMKKPIPLMFTANNFSLIMSNYLTQAAQEAWTGNWVLGMDSTYMQQMTSPSIFMEELTSFYLNQYAAVWESFLANISLYTPQNLNQLDTIIAQLTQHPSPLLKLLQIVHQNTQFEPILTVSSKLQAINFMAGNEQLEQNNLLEIFNSLKSLRVYLQPILHTTNTQRAAYDILSMRMSNAGQPDAILQLRAIAEKNPEPIKTWLINIADRGTHLLMREAAQYIDTSWQNNVIDFYAKEIAHHYPFASPDQPDVDINKFAAFFANSGIMLSYINQTLKPFIDTSAAEWHWKTFGNKALPFSDDTLRQIQLATRIHKSFFPQGGDNLQVQFTLQPYELGKLIKAVTLNIDNKFFTDSKETLKNSHTVTWPTAAFSRNTSILLTLENNQSINHYYPGQWGWLKLINQSFESMRSKKQLLLNLSMNEHTAKYLLKAEGQYHPFSSLDLKHFHLPSRLIDDNQIGEIA